MSAERKYVDLLAALEASVVGAKKERARRAKSSEVTVDPVAAVDVTPSPSGATGPVTSDTTQEVTP